MKFGTKVTSEIAEMNMLNVSIKLSKGRPPQFFDVALFIKLGNLTLIGTHLVETDSCPMSQLIRLLYFQFVSSSI